MILDTMAEGAFYFMIGLNGKRAEIIFRQAGISCDVCHDSVQASAPCSLDGGGHCGTS